MKKIKKLCFLLTLLLSSVVILAHNNPSSHSNKQIPEIRLGEKLVSPILTLIDVPCYDEMWPDDMGGDLFTISNTGTEALTFQLSTSGFITAITPDIGSIPPGESTLIHLTYSSAGNSIGNYQQDIELVTNDPGNPVTQIGNTMVVYAPAIVYGVVTDCITELPVSGVIVGPGFNFNVETDGVGYYELRVDAGTYDILFSKLGYGSLFVAGVVATQGSPLELNVGICPTSNPVPWVLADPNEADTECLVTWALPAGPYELLYDDGTWEDITNWSTSGGMVSVRFTPEGYPVTVTGGRLDVGDGSFPVGGNFLGTNLKISILDDDGTGGLPGTVLDSVLLSVDEYGWLEFSDVFDITLDDGDFYLAMTQMGTPDNSAPITSSTDSPLALRSYSKAPGGNWMSETTRDYRIRAYAFGSNNLTTTKNSESIGFSSDLPNLSPPISRDMQYAVSLVSNFDPCGDPSLGTITPIANPTTTSYNHMGWGGLPPGFYAYAISANQSGFTYSNVVAHLMDAEVTVNVTLCNGESPEGSEVILTGMDCPNQYEFQLSGLTGVVVFDSIIFGNYELHVFKVGYNPVTFDINITQNTEINVVLTQKLYKARNLVVDSTTNIATWDEPVITALEVEGFEGTDFPPPGWQSTTIGMGWIRVEDGGSTGFPVPPGDGHYAITNSDMYPDVDASLDYLITPNIDLRESPTFTLHFDHFFTMNNGEAAYVEYSLDAGATWEVLQSLSPGTSWTSEEVDLSTLSGLSGESNIWFAFHYTNNNNTARGWAIDNVSITNGPPPFLLGYYIYLEGAFVAETDLETRTYTFTNWYYGQTYAVGISARYNCEIAEPTESVWTSGFLYPSRNMEDQYVDGSVEVPLRWNPPSDYVTKGSKNVDFMQDTIDILFDQEQSNHFERIRNLPDGLINFRLYQNEVEIGQIPYEGQGISDWVYDTVRGIDPGDYVFGVTAEYDLTSYGFPGETRESLQDYSDTVHVTFGTIIPFLEDWSSGSFELNGWQVSRSNWQINTQEGSPAPAAQFSGEPMLENGYSSTLTSYSFRADQLTEGVLYLDVDIGLDDINATGLEMLDVEVYDGNLWHTVASYSNEGSFDFTTCHLDITEFGMSEFLKIRFNAHGQHSNDLNSWFVDNISLYRVCESVDDLAAREYNLEDAMISWMAPVVITKTTVDVTQTQNRQMTGFNVYRKTDEISIYELYDFLPAEPGQEAYTYLDETTEVGTGYWYQVTCVWESETDYCESSPGFNVAMTADFVYILITDMNEQETDYLTLYPNPVGEKITVVSNIPMNQLTIMNYAGKVVYKAQLAGESKVVLNTASYETGVYVVQIVTDKGITTKRVVIAE